MPETAAVLKSIPAAGEHPGAKYRLAGDSYVVVEYGPMELDIALRVRIWALQNSLTENKVGFLGFSLFRCDEILEVPACGMLTQTSIICACA